MTPGDIPSAQQAAAASFGKLVALGAIESKDAVESLYSACVRSGYQGDEAGLRTRLWWIVRDTAEEWQVRRIQAEYKLRREISPLLDARSPSWSILGAAHAACQALDSPFLRHEVLAIVQEEMVARQALRRGKTKARFHGR